MLHSRLSWRWLLILAWLAGAGPASATPVLPLINTNNIISITNAPYNALGDGTSTNTTAIQSAINAATLGGSTNGLTGGTVRFPAGVYLSGPLQFKNAVNLQLDGGAILRMLPLGKYPLAITTNITTTYTTNVSLITTNRATNFTYVATDFLSASSLHDIALSGPGAVDGQGAPWWPYANTNGFTRPIMFRPNSCNRILVQNVTLSNSPMFHIAVGGKSGNTTVQGVTIRANPSSDPVAPGHNTDACDVSGTNILVQNCDISVGDDNYTCGGGTSGVLLTNNTYGYGHGVSIGSYTDGAGVSNITVINCTFSGTDQGIRIKSDRDRGGVVQNIAYYNLSMTNVMRPILIYEEYTNTTSAFRAVDSITPDVAAAYPIAIVSATTPIYRNIIISNLTATVQAGRTAGLIWGLPEMRMTNIVLNKIRITADKTFGIYNASGVQLIDSQITTPAGVTNLAFYNTQVAFTNSSPATNLISLDGTITNTIANGLALYNAAARIKNTNALANAFVLTLGGGTLAVSNHLALAANAVMNFILGTNASTLVVASNLTVNGTINVGAGAGFTSTNYVLFNYGKVLTWGTPVLGTQPVGYTYAWDTNTIGKVQLVVTPPVPAAPANLLVSATNLALRLSWAGVTNATSYNLKRGTINGGPYPVVTAGLTTTNYLDGNLTSGMTYYYVVTAVNAGGESTNSAPATGVPLPSAVPTQIALQFTGSQWQLSWPADHLGWRLQCQTNFLSTGLGTNWADVAGSGFTNQMVLPVSPENGAVFLRLVYP